MRVKLKGKEERKERRLGKERQWDSQREGRSEMKVLGRKVHDEGRAKAKQL